MTDIAGLIERVEKATGADREIDFALMKMFDEDAFMVMLEIGELQDGDERTLSETADAWCVHVDYAGGSSANGGYRKITASIDAALALVERKLPDWRIEQISWGKKGDDIVIVSIGNFGVGADYRSGWGEARTPPLAILAALLRALAQTGGER